MSKFENITELIVRIFIKKDNKILLCKNKKYGHYFLPGGHVEFGDSLEETIYKEMNEELGLAKSDIKNISFKNYIESSYFSEDTKHCELNMIFIAKIDEGIEIKSREGHIDFEWIELNKIHEINLFPVDLKNILN